ncbi:MAG: hypothetical protein ACYDCB_12320, partial [Candidatus Dormibacteria bacterium]
VSALARQFATQPGRGLGVATPGACGGRSGASGQALEKAASIAIRAARTVRARIPQELSTANLLALRG